MAAARGGGDERGEPGSTDASGYDVDDMVGVAPEDADADAGGESPVSMVVEAGAGAASVPRRRALDLSNITRFVTECVRLVFFVSQRENRVNDCLRWYYLTLIWLAFCGIVQADAG